MQELPLYTQCWYDIQAVRMFGCFRLQEKSHEFGNNPTNAVCNRGCRHARRGAESVRCTPYGMRTGDLVPESGERSSQLSRLTMLLGG